MCPYEQLFKVHYTANDEHWQKQQKFYNTSSIYKTAKFDVYNLGIQDPSTKSKLS